MEPRTETVPCWFNFDPHPPCTFLHLFNSHQIGQKGQEGKNSKGLTWRTRRRGPQCPETQQVSKRLGTWAQRLNVFVSGFQMSGGKKWSPHRHVPGDFFRLKEPESIRQAHTRLSVFNRLCALRIWAVLVVALGFASPW